MPCCGQRRAALKRGGSRSRLGAFGPAPGRPPAPSEEELRLAYLANAAIRVQGSSTRRIYEFSSSEPVQRVHASDAAGLLRTGLFRRA
jgi:hypothetical protein